MLRTEVHTRGPIFDGAAPRVIADFIEAATRAVAEEGAEDLRAATSVFKNPTGFYKSQVNFHRQGSDFMIDDGGVIYGPWLEGTSTRNRTTRFKGYKIWRQTTQRLQAKARRIAERVLTRYLGRLQ